MAFLRWPDLLAVGIVLFGVAIRLREYAFNRSLWLDEALLALNVTGHGLHLSNVREQAAPVGFLAVVELTTRVFGASEPALRLLPLLAGIAAIAVFYRLAAIYYDTRTAVFCAFILSLSGLLIYYSTEFKQYSVDGLIGVCLLWQFHRLSGANGHRDYVSLGVAGAVAILFSHPACLMLGSIGVVLAAGAARQRQWDRITRLTCCAVIWLLIFAFVYSMNVGSAARSEMMQTFHQASFAPVGVSAATIHWYVNTIESFFMYALEPRLWLLCLVLFVAGAASAYRQSMPIAWLMGANVVLLWAVSALHLYPIHQRFLVYLYPLASLVIAVGAARLTQGATPATVVLLLVMAHPVLTDRVRELIRPAGREETRELVEVVLRQRGPNEGLVVWGATTPAYLYYSEVIRARAEGGEYTTIDGDIDSQLDAEQVHRALASAHHPRVWVLASHMNAGGFGADNLRTLREALGTVANVEREWVRRDGFLWYCQLRPGEQATD